MSAILIERDYSTEYGRYIELHTDGMSISVNFENSGGVRICVKNASHRVWRGFGKHFDTVEAALENYKSAKAKTLIRAALDLKNSENFENPVI